ncbi:putative OsmC-like protein [Inquilinus ginsengisoli]|uniref:OsmC family protein n=1 Tax=Inquilinus ginsengisoli TaxID=363840 RepID=UPI003D23330A
MGAGRFCRPRWSTMPNSAGARDAAIDTTLNINTIMGASMKATESTVVNGINVDDLFALIDDIKREPEKGKTNWHVITTWQGQMRSRAEVEGYEFGGEKIPRWFSIDIDEPRELGGSNKFANPQEYLIAALNACMTVGYVAQCAVRGITLESLSIETDGDIDLRGFLGIDSAVPPGYEKLSYRVRIKGSGTNEQFTEIHNAVMATSPNFYNLSQAVALKPALIVE